MTKPLISKRRNPNCPIDGVDICAPDGVGGCTACDDGEGHYKEPLTSNLEVYLCEGPNDCSIPCGIKLVRFEDYERLTRHRAEATKTATDRLVEIERLRADAERYRWLRRNEVAMKQIAETAIAYLLINEDDDRDAVVVSVIDHAVDAKLVPPDETTPTNKGE